MNTLISTMNVCGDGNEWWKLPDGTLHRIGGPAITYTATATASAAYMYLVNGKFHRDDGPAKDQFDDTTGAPLYEWFLNGIKHDTFKQYCETLQLYYGKTDADIAAIKAAYPLA